MSIYSDTAPVSPDFWGHEEPAATPEWVVKPTNWRARAACLDEDPEVFFPLSHGTTKPALIQLEEAKKVCRRCDVRERCLEWALEKGEDHGVWGGLSEEERRALKRRKARQ